ncbi:MAG: hypothetical protein A2580_11785 [Hydrogenophilales bacterium RIFOXYD1_FULL_62_11]|nr:MAG: hypothetical protein A2580_11785 [Hydrogenophilales bacterium RIFOXYD1_FULL_62_11]
MNKLAGNEEDFLFAGDYEVVGPDPALGFEVVAGMGGRVGGNDSAAEQLASHVQQSRVVKAFNMITADNFPNQDFYGGPLRSCTAVTTTVRKMLPGR